MPGLNGSLSPAALFHPVEAGQPLRILPGRTMLFRERRPVTGRGYWQDNGSVEELRQGMAHGTRF